MFEGPSNFVESVDSAFMFITVISVAILLGVTFLMIYFVIKYNRKRNPKAVNIHGNIKLEIAWTVIPTILVLGMFWFGWVGYKKMASPPADAIVIEAQAQMWEWKFNYADGFQTDTLYVPLNEAVKLDLRSLDVNHSFFIPAFRVKKDVIPNRNNFVWFIGTETGSFDIACAEYCGLNHWNMYTKVVVLPRSQYDSWYSEQLKAKDKGTGKAPQQAAPDTTAEQNQQQADTTAAE